MWLIFSEVGDANWSGVDFAWVGNIRKWVLGHLSTQYYMNITKILISQIYIINILINYHSWIFHPSHKCPCLWYVAIKLCSAEVKAWMLLLESFSHHFFLKFFFFERVQIIMSFKNTAPSNPLLGFLNLNNYLFFSFLFWTILTIP